MKNKSHIYKFCILVSLILIILLLGIMIFILENANSKGKNGTINDSLRTAIPEENGLLDDLAKSAYCSVEIEAGTLIGEGIIYESNDSGIVIVTAGHVIEGSGSVEVSFKNGSVCESSEIYVSNSADCGFIFIEADKSYADAEGYTDKDSGGVRIKKDRKVFDAVENGSDIFLADFNADNETGCRYSRLVESWIYVEDFDQYMMLLEGVASAGMSGCGVLDENGVFLGILCGINDEGMLAVTPYSVVDACFLEKQFM